MQLTGSVIVSPSLFLISVLMLCALARIFRSCLNSSPWSLWIAVVSSSAACSSSFLYLVLRICSGVYWAVDIHWCAFSVARVSVALLSLGYPEKSKGNRPGEGLCRVFCSQPPECLFWRIQMPHSHPHFLHSQHFLWIRRWEFGWIPGSLRRRRLNLQFRMTYVLLWVSVATKNFGDGARHCRGVHCDALCIG